MEKGTGAAQCHQRYDLSQRLLVYPVPSSAGGERTWICWNSKYLLLVVESSLAVAQSQKLPIGFYTTFKKL